MRVQWEGSVDTVVDTHPPVPESKTLVGNQVPSAYDLLFGVRDHPTGSTQDTTSGLEDRPVSG